jgi:hypothetical protein
MPESSEVRYLVVPDNTYPYLLARVRWPDVAQAITAGCPDWVDDPGLFDLPNDPSSATVTFNQAAAIAAAWGVSLFGEETFHSAGPSLIRRMPANWSNLAPAEIRAWSLDFVDTTRRVDASRNTSRTRARNASSTSRRRWRSLLRTLEGSTRRPRLEPQMRTAELAGPPTATPVRDESWGLDIASIPSISVPDTPLANGVTNGHVLTGALNDDAMNGHSSRDEHSATVLHSTVSASLGGTSESVLQTLESEARSIIDNGGELEPPIGGRDMSL